MSSTTSDGRPPLNKLSNDELFALYRAGSLRGDDRIALFEMMRKRGIDPERYRDGDGSAVVNPMTYRPLDGGTATSREWWRILIWAQLVASAFFSVAGLVAIITPFILDDAFAAVTDPGSDHYLPGFETFLIGEGVLLVLYLAYLAYVIRLFTRSSRLFPAFFVGMFGVNVLVRLAESYLFSTFLDDTTLFGERSALDVVGPLFMAALWVPYIMMSRKVKETFVR